MKKPGESRIQWIKLRLKQGAASLRDVITTGGQPYILIGVDKWKDTFVPGARYQVSNAREGVSVSMSKSYGKYGIKVRVGVLYDATVRSYLTYIGFGTWGSWHQRNGVVVSCGNGRKTSNTLPVNNPAFCYILVQ
jgi:hypothetical protein